MKVSIIGSFRKYHKEINEIILLLQRNKIDVLSPKYSEITHSIDDFVVLSSDNRKLTPVSYTHLDVYKRQRYGRSGADFLN